MGNCCGIPRVFYFLPDHELHHPSEEELRKFLYTPLLDLKQRIAPTPDHPQVTIVCNPPEDWCVEGGEMLPASYPHLNLTLEDVRVERERDPLIQVEDPHHHICFLVAPDQITLVRFPDQGYGIRFGVGEQQVRRIARYEGSTIITNEFEFYERHEVTQLELVWTGKGQWHAVGYQIRSRRLRQETIQSERQPNCVSGNVLIPEVSIEPRWLQPGELHLITRRFQHHPMLVTGWLGPIQLAYWG